MHIREKGSLLFYQYRHAAPLVVRVVVMGCKW